MTFAMRNRVRSRPFDVVTIAGYRYTVTFDEVFSWLGTKWFWITMLILQVFLITLLPHNQFYGLSYIHRIWFWPFTTFGYIVIYLICTYLAALYLSANLGRQYYSPLGVFVAALGVTYVTTYLLGQIHGEEVQFGMFKWMEVVFNLLWASIVEAFHFAFNVPRIRRAKREKTVHEWEQFE